jgi:hypothetical protein
MPGNLLGASRPGCISSYGRAAIVDVHPSLQRYTRGGTDRRPLRIISHLPHSRQDRQSEFECESPTSRHMSVSGANRGEAEKKSWTST